jgi:hypothetical protein
MSTDADHPDASMSIVVRRTSLQQLAAATRIRQHWWAKARMAHAQPLQPVRRYRRSVMISVP